MFRYGWSVAACLVMASLAACGLIDGGDEGQIKELVEERLKDPSSVKFGDFVMSSDGKRACIIWNAKNSFGGYGGWEVAEARKRYSGEWMIEDMDGLKHQCTEKGFTTKDAEETAWTEAEKNAMQLLMDAKSISYGEANELTRITGACYDLFIDYLGVATGIAEAENKMKYGPLADWEREGLEERKAKLPNLESRLAQGDC